MIYLDNSAGTRPHPEVIETIINVLTNHWGNASADNSSGKDAMRIIDEVTQQVANDMNCRPDELIWTSGACEANSLAINGLLTANRSMILCTSQLEHASINNAIKDAPSYIRYTLANDRKGCVELNKLEEICREIVHKWHSIPFVSVSFANSEIGVIQDIKSIARIVHQYCGLIHVDATQMYPWSQINVEDLGIDLMSVSGQKFNSVKGVGVLYVRYGIKINPIIYGSQQDGRRGGTYPTHLIAAFGKALEITRKDKLKWGHVAMLRDRLLGKLLQIGGVYVNGSLSSRLPNNISLIIDDVNASTLVAMCDLMGIIISKGSACKSYEAQPSEALLAIGLTPQQALNTIRISLDQFTSEEEIDIAGDIITKLVERIRYEN